MSDLIDRINTELATINHSNNATSAHDLLDECKSTIKELEVELHWLKNTTIPAIRDKKEEFRKTIKELEKALEIEGAEADVKINELEATIEELVAECEELKRANTAHVALSILTARASKDNDK